MKKLVCLILALTMVLALCACGAKTEEAPVAEAPVEEAAVETVDEAAEEPNGIVPGTVINFAAPVDLDSFFPWGSMRSQHFVQQVYDTKPLLQHDR